MNTTNISSKEIRNSVGYLIDLVHFTGNQVRITRRKQVMARLVGEPLMKVFEQLIANDPTLADTVALMLNEELMQDLLVAEENAERGNKRPIEALLNEL